MEKTQKITWKTDIRRLGDLLGWPENPRYISDSQGGRLQKGLRDFGYSQLIEIDPENGILDGHQRDSLMLVMDEFGPDAEIEVRVASRKFTVDERATYIALKHRGATGQWNWDLMHNLYTDPQKLVTLGFDPQELLSQGYIFGSNDPPDFSDLDKQLEDLDGFQDVDIKITIPKKYQDDVIDFLSNGERKTAPGLGKGVVKLCGLL